MKEKLTVVLVFKKGGDYTIKDVTLIAFHLRKQWEGYLQILCICEGFSAPFKITEYLTAIPMSNLWQGWWSKMNMFSPEMEKYRPFLYVDLDTAIVGSLNAILPPIDQTKFITLENVYYPGHIGSGMMWIPANNDKIKAIWDKWIADPAKGMTDPGGDQKFIEKIVDVDDYFEKVRITSFKPLPKKNWLLSLNKEHSIVYFHGFPRIPQAAQKVPWVANYLKCEEIKETKITIQKYFVINLDSRPDRLQQFNENEFPFEIERFSAIRKVPGIKGCNASHLAILNKDCALPFVVFEDDCKLIEDWSIVETAMKQLPKDWDILLVGANLNTPLEQYSENLFKVKNAWTTHAIIYGAQGVVDYIKKKMPKDSTPIDAFYSKHIYPNFNCFVVNPLVAIQRCSFSDINNGVRNYEELMIANFKQNTQRNRIMQIGLC
jgi:GR25 family glycosyltransferase involved in LPS biosynthesis